MKWLLAACVMFAVSFMARPAYTANLPPAVASYLGSLAADCYEVGGLPEKPRPWFMLLADLNGDGIEDWIIKDDGFVCDRAASLYGGSGGSQVTVFVGLPNGDARQAFGNGAYAMKLEQHGATTTLWLAVGGRLCGQAHPRDMADARQCWRPIAWNAATGRFGFAPLSRIRIVSPDVSK